MRIDLRSDTVTQPSAEMRAAIASAAVGDDVLGDDPTVQELESRVARRLGKEAALFVPSGVMANQLALRAHTQPGQQVLVEDGCHIYRYEAGAPAALSGVQLTMLRSEHGFFTAEEMLAALNPDDPHCAPPSLVCVENSHNRHGGTVWPLAMLAELAEAVRAKGLALHMDGARLWNASVAAGLSESEFAAQVDSVAVCCSKGLGAPVGSLLAGDADFVARARRLRKQWGGGMRQVGILAAACLYALDHHYEGLAQDHDNAAFLAREIHHPAFSLLRSPQTNIVMFEMDDAMAAQSALREAGVLAWTMAPTRLRMVTHRDVDRADCEQVVRVVNALEL